MTHDTAQAVVNGVAQRHPKFKPNAVQLTPNGCLATFDEPTVDPRRISMWFEEEGYYVVQVGYDLPNQQWYLYFREVNHA